MTDELDGSSEPTIRRSPKSARTEPTARTAPTDAAASEPEIPLPSESSLPPVDFGSPALPRGVALLGHSARDPSVPLHELVNLKEFSLPDEEYDESDPGPGDTNEIKIPTADGEELEDTGLWQSPYPAGAEEVLPGERIVGERYRLDEPLADGGMASVHRVTHVNLDKPFALKVIQQEQHLDPRAGDRFIREARMASQLDHPHIVQVTDFGVDPGLGAYIVMEYLKGESLRQRLDHHGGLPLNVALPIVSQTAQALRYMHQRQIIHCDVKSENVFLCRLPDDQRQRVHIKVIDFGLSRYTAAGATLADNEVGGTPDYIAPEMILGAGPQPSVDIYALGVLFYEVVTGKMPFSGSAKELLVAHLHHPPVPPSERLPEGLDPRIEEFILKLLAKRPVDRPDSMSAVLYELRHLTERLGLEGGGRRVRPSERIRLATLRDRELANLRAVFDHAPIPLFRVDSEGAVLEANAAFCNFVALPYDRVVGSYIGLTGLDQVYPYIGVRLVEAVRRGDVEPLVHTATYVTGRGPITVKVTLVPELNDDSHVTHFTGTVHPLGF